MIVSTLHDTTQVDHGGWSAIHLFFHKYGRMYMNERMYTGRHMILKKSSIFLAEFFSW